MNETLSSGFAYLNLVVLWSTTLNVMNTVQSRFKQFVSSTVKCNPCDFEEIADRLWHVGSLHAEHASALAAGRDLALEDFIVGVQIAAEKAANAAQLAYDRLQFAKANWAFAERQLEAEASARQSTQCHMALHTVQEAQAYEDLMEEQAALLYELTEAERNACADEDAATDFPVEDEPWQMECYRDMVEEPDHSNECEEDYAYADFPTYRGELHVIELDDEIAATFLTEDYVDQLAERQWQIRTSLENEAYHVSDMTTEELFERAIDAAERAAMTDPGEDGEAYYKWSVSRDDDFELPDGWITDLPF